MTYDETLVIMAIIKAAYPNYYRDMKRKDAEGVVNVWRSMFTDDNPELVTAAVHALIASDEKGFPPHIGAVKAYIRKITEPDQMTEGEAWALISKALRNGLYGAKEEFERLPPILQKIVGSPNQLKEWAMMDLATVQSVVSSNVMRSYKVMANREREFNALPSNIKALITASGLGQKQLEEGK